MNELVLTGRRFVTTITATAGNVDTNITINDSETRLFLYAARIVLVCDATVATRNIAIRRQITTGPVSLGAIMRGIDTTAGQTSSLAIASTYYATNAATSGFIGEGAVHSINLFGMSISNGQRLNITIQNGVAGDSYSGNVEWLEVPA